MDYSGVVSAYLSTVPDHCGRKAAPAQGWRVEDKELVILCADGRKVRCPVDFQLPAHLQKSKPAAAAAQPAKTAPKAVKTEK